MEEIHANIGVNKFVRRQKKNSGKTYTEKLSFEEIAAHAGEQMAKGLYKPGYRDGVILVSTANNLLYHYICPFVKIDENTKLRAKVVRRRPEEEPYIQIRALNGIPLKTGSVDLILYRHDVLTETDEQTTDSDWELISFHAIPEGTLDMPMGPITMMRNQLQLLGGTKAYYESNQWAQSVKFWNENVALEGNS